MPNVIMHCNYFEQGYRVEATFEKALEHGYDGVEMRGRPRDAAMGLDEYLDLVEREKQRTGLEVVLALRGNHVDEDPDARKAALEHCTHVLKRGTEMGVTTFNARPGKIRPEHMGQYQFDKAGSGAATEKHWQWVADAHRILGEIAQQAGARIGFETHCASLTDLAAATRKLVDLIASPAVGVNLDMANIALHPTGETLEEALDILAGKIYYTHIKNLYLVPGGGSVGCRVSDGVIDNYKFVQTLKEQGYDGPIGMEVSGRGDHDYFAKVDLAYIRSVVADLDWD